MQRITIEIADDGRASVMAEMEGAEPQAMEFDSPGQALEAVASMLADSAIAAEEQGAAMPEAEAEAMWNEEASKRPAQMGLMA